MISQPWLYLAPIQGVTCDAFQGIYQKNFSGIDCYMAPFVRVRLQGKMGKAKKALLPQRKESLNMLPQLLANQANEFIQFDTCLNEAGYTVFNWNMGCPMRMVTRKKRGSGLLPYPEEIESILESIAGKLQSRLSVKVRLGLNHAEELLHLMSIFNRFDLDRIMIHARLGNQGYAGHVDLENFEKCLELSKHPVVYNGDIFAVETFHRLQKQFPQIQEWIIGRGALANPFLPAQIKGDFSAPEDKLDRIRSFHTELENHYQQILSSPRHIVDKMLAIWYYLHHLFVEGESFFGKLKKTKYHEKYHAAVETFFATQPAIKEHLEMCSEDFG